jgi:SAM-dependent methyltransferase
MSDTWNAATYDSQFGFVSSGGGPVLERLAPRSGERILDLGCGTGELAAQVAAAGAEVVGLDADSAMVSRARERFPELRFVHANAESEAWAAQVGTFDAVFSNAALHWMKPAPVLTILRQVVRPGGRFVGELGGDGNTDAILSALRQARAAVGLPERAAPWFFPSIAAYAGLLDRAGFEPRWLELVDRPTSIHHLERGLLDWLRMFGARLFDDLTQQQAADLEQAAAELARPALFRDGHWIIDYRRLRFEAVARRSGRQ